MDRTERTLRVLARDMKMSDAAEELRALESRLHRALGGLPVTADVLVQAVELASVAIPPPQGHGWEADVQGGGRLSVYMIATDATA